MASRERRSPALAAAVKRRIASMLLNYADTADTDHDPTTDTSDADLIRGVRFAAELTAGHIHNPHSPTCACPCTKPDPVAIPPPEPPTLPELVALTQVIKNAGLSANHAGQLARTILDAGYRLIPDTLMPGPADDGLGMPYRADVPAYPRRLPDGTHELLVPCWECDRWHTYPDGKAVPGDRVFLAAACPPESWTGDFLAVVQAAAFNPLWESRGRIGRAYRAVTPDARR